MTEQTVYPSPTLDCENQCGILSSLRKFWHDVINETVIPKADPHLNPAPSARSTLRVTILNLVKLHEMRMTQNRHTSKNVCLTQLFSFELVTAVINLSGSVLVQFCFTLTSSQEGPDRISRSESLMRKGTLLRFLEVTCQRAAYRYPQQPNWFIQRNDQICALSLYLCKIKQLKKVTPYDWMTSTFQYYDNTYCICGLRTESRWKREQDDQTKYLSLLCVA